MSKKKNKKQRRTSRPSFFSTPVECVTLLKKSTYLIARGRIANPDNPSQLNWISIGTGCVVAPHRMITAAHVITDTTNQNELFQHKDGDRYYFIKHDDENNWHFQYTVLELNTNLFLYPEVDLAVIYLNDQFYATESEVYVQKDDFIRIDKKFRNIATEIGVLGYPLCRLDFQNNDIKSPKVGDVLLRVDTGVINSRYTTSQLHRLYEFTVAFNPGNSGGPIFDIRTGQLLSIVRGYRTQPIKQGEVLLSTEDKQKLNINTYQENAYIDVVHATYSVGFATSSFIEIFIEHDIVD